MTTIGLIRHGVTPWNAEGRIQGQTDIPLSEEGIEQARALAERLAKEQGAWDYVISSELGRARETARIIADKLGIPLLEEDRRFSERSFGSFEGTTLKERIDRWGTDWKQHDPGAETDEALRQRAAEGIEALCERYEGHRILVVTHGGLLAQLIIRLFGEDHQEHIGNTSFTVIRQNDRGWDKLIYNCTAHLATTRN